MFYASIKRPIKKNTGLNFDSSLEVNCTKPIVVVWLLSNLGTTPVRFVYKQYQSGVTSWMEQMVTAVVLLMDHNAFRLQRSDFYGCVNGKARDS